MMQRVAWGRAETMGIGATLPLSGEGGTAPSWAQIRAFAAAADVDGGLDSLWVYDHLLFRFPDEPDGAIHEAWTVLSALAVATRRVELGALVMCTSFRNAGLMAKMAAAADEISGGRLVLGLGAGWHEPEYRAFGYPFDRLASRFEESIGITVPLLRGDRVDVAGTSSSASDALLLPPPARPGGPPILIAGKRPRMLRLTARYADAYNTAWYARPNERLTESRAALVAACEAEGRDPAEIAFTVGVTVSFGEPDPEIPAERQLVGDETVIADGLRAFRDVGVDHVMCALDGKSPESVARLVEAASRVRAG
jgi:alkanesulfonate monooxygenase SsuD/methylene tetrahydromethanopterin reductase-like flavin-dependent oxidoreductase (luciferase family)